MRRLLALGICSALLGVGGCVPSNVLWLPDSSGIVFSDKGGTRLVRYDLKRNARKVLVADTKTKTPWPAISTDGKKLAVMETITYVTKDSTEEKTTFRFILYSIDGEELTRTKVHERTKDLKEASKVTARTLEESALNWSGPADKIMLVGGLYDLTKDKLIPVDGMPGYFYNRPVRPDKKGFLVFGSKTLSFCDWDGWESAVRDTSSLDDKDEDFVHFGWRKNSFLFYRANKVTSFDTDAGRFDSVAEKAEYMAGRGKVKLVFPFAGGEAKLCYFERPEDDSKPNGASFGRVEIQRPAKLSRKVVVEEGLYRLDPLNFFPSPDDRLMAVRTKERNSSGKEVILVIDESGETLAKVEVEK